MFWRGTWDATKHHALQLGEVRGRSERVDGEGRRELMGTVAHRGWLTVTQEEKNSGQEHGRSDEDR